MERNEDPYCLCKYWYYDEIPLRPSNLFFLCNTTLSRDLGTKLTQHAPNPGLEYISSVVRPGECPVGKFERYMFGRSARPNLPNHVSFGREEVFPSSDYDKERK